MIILILTGTRDNTHIDRYDRKVQVAATKTTERESRDLDRQPKIKLNRYNRKLTGYTDTTKVNPTNTTLKGINIDGKSGFTIHTICYTL